MRTPVPPHPGLPRRRPRCHHHEPPRRRNALSEAHLLELTDALRSLADREEVRAIVLAAAGPVYSSGHDFADMAERGLDGMRKLFAVCEEFMLTIQRVPQRGGGTGAGHRHRGRLSAGGDLRSRSRRGRRHLRHAQRQGRMVLHDADARRCRAPSATSARSSCSSRAIPSTHGPPLAWGLVNRVVPAESLATETVRLARTASRGSRESKAIGKRAYYDTIDLDLSAAYAHASEVMATSSMRDEARRGHTRLSGAPPAPSSSTGRVQRSSLGKSR